MQNYQIIEADPIQIFVESVIQDEERKLRDIKPPIYIPFNYRFAVSMVIAGLLVGLIAFLGYRFYKKRKQEGYLFKPPEPPRPAHEIALENLEALLRKGKQ